LLFEDSFAWHESFKYKVAIQTKIKDQTRTYYFGPKLSLSLQKKDTLDIQERTGSLKKQYKFPNNIKIVSGICNLMGHLI